MRLLIVVTTAKNWHLHQLDVNNAFLRGDFIKEVYMVLPQGLDAEKPNQVCHFKKFLYGLKQASRQWYAKLIGSLLNNGFVQSPSDQSLFMKKTDSSSMALLVYVDDIILAGNNVNNMNEVKHFLNENFRIKDLG